MTIPRARSDAAFEFAGIVLVVLTVVIAIAAPVVSLWLMAPYFGWAWRHRCSGLAWLDITPGNHAKERADCADTYLTLRRGYAGGCLLKLVPPRYRRLS